MEIWAQGWSHPTSDNSACVCNTWKAFHRRTRGWKERAELGAAGEVGLWVSTAPGSLGPSCSDIKIWAAKPSKTWGCRIPWGAESLGCRRWDAGMPRACPLANVPSSAYAPTFVKPGPKQVNVCRSDCWDCAGCSKWRWDGMGCKRSLIREIKQVRRWKTPLLALINWESWKWLRGRVETRGDTDWKHTWGHMGTQTKVTPALPCGHRCYSIPLSWKIK